MFVFVMMETLSSSPQWLDALLPIKYLDFEDVFNKGICITLMIFQSIYNWGKSHHGANLYSITSRTQGSSRVYRGALGK